MSNYIDLYCDNASRQLAATIKQAAFMTTPIRIEDEATINRMKKIACQYPNENTLVFYLQGHENGSISALNIDIKSDYSILFQELATILVYTEIDTAVGYNQFINNPQEVIVEVDVYNILAVSCLPSEHLQIATIFANLLKICEYV